MKLGSRDVKAVRVGDRAVARVLLGDRLVWEAGGEPEPGGPAPVIADTLTGVNTLGLEYNVALPASAPGDLLVILVRVSVTNGDAGVTPPAGWDALTTPVAAWGTLTVLSRFADGSEGATVQVSAHRGIFAAWVVHRITGASAVEAAESNTADPPALNPSWGEADTLWLAATSTRRGNINYTSPPAGYSGLVSAVSQEGATGTGHCRIAAAQKTSVSAGEDPGAFTATSSPDQPRSATVAVRPA